MQNVDWNLISKSVNYYVNRGFQYQETSWIVPRSTSLITCPSVDNIFPTMHDQSLVGSAEQGFLQLVLDGQLPTDKAFVSAGPCFRNEMVDRYHQHQFFKVELFLHSLDQETAAASAKNFLNQAYGFMVLHSNTQPNIVDEGFGWDININGIEVGSYGYRYQEELGFWAYGTGLAEPRFSLASKTQIS
jgi:hypothetical protein